MDLTTIIKGTKFTKTCVIKPDKESKLSKTITLELDYEGLTLSDVFSKAVRTDVISWQNGPGRKTFATLADKSTIKVSAKAPSTQPQIDPETAMVAKLQSMTPEEQKTYINEVLLKGKK